MVGTLSVKAAIELKRRYSSHCSAAALPPISRDRPKNHMGGMIPLSMRGAHFSDYATEDVRFKQRL